MTLFSVKIVGNLQTPLFVFLSKEFMLKNTLKVFGNNFIIVWKQLVYLLIVAAISFGLIALLALPIVNLVRSSGWFAMLDTFIETIYTAPQTIAVGFNELATELWHILAYNSCSYWASYFLIIFVIFFLSSFLYNISFYALGSVIDARMSSYAKFGYTHKLVSELGRGISYSFFKFVYSLPFYLLLLVFGYTYGKLANTVLSAVVMLPILIVAIIAIKSLNIAFLAGMLPAMIIDNSSSYASLGVGFKTNAKYFWRIFSNSIILVLCEIVAIVFFGIFTVGAGLFVVIPSIAVINTTFTFVTYYSSKKQRYYLNENLIVKPL